jgi:hypothetical protein
VFEPEPQVTCTPLVAVPFTVTCPSIVAPLVWANIRGVVTHASAAIIITKPAIRANLCGLLVILSPMDLVERLPVDV